MKSELNKFLLILLFVPALLTAQNIEQIYPYLEKLCKEFHQYPELSLQEERTSQRIGEELRKLGFEVTEKVGGYGLVGILKNGEGKKLLLRTDMDALPIEEKTELPFSSKNKGVMHACGHDIHMSVFIGAANILANNKDKWNGTLMMVAQPAEEIGRGSKLMLEAGLYQKFGVPDYALAIHVATGVEAGNIAYYPGNAMANASSVTIKVHGLGGHGALPQNTIDPIVIASQMVMAFQTIVSREVSPFEPAVVTVGYIKGGTKHNIIPNEVELGLTVRSFNDELHSKIIESIRNKSKNIALSYGLPDNLLPEVTISDETPSVYNNPELTERILNLLEIKLGDNNIFKTSRWTAAEDFANYGRTKEKVPSLMLWVGSEKKETMEKIANGIKTPILHSADFNPDYERTIKTGLFSITESAYELLRKN
jgi:hippurate hydrolase